MKPGPDTSTTHPWGDAETPFVEIGGTDRVRELVEAFYDVIEEQSPHLRAMLPRKTTGSRQKLYEFLTGWLGGPQLYWEKHGHPRLRMRHFPFTIGDAEAAEWMRCMEVAMDRCGVTDPLRAFLTTKLTESAQHLRNQPS